MSNLRILIVEDEAITARATQIMLESMGFQVVAIVDTGEDAIATAERTRPDLVLMDIRLKGEMSGIQAGVQISDRLHLPIVFVTAYSASELCEQESIPKRFHYLAKPIDALDLSSLLDDMGLNPVNGN
jgi:CheY-like chemotaxis protein